ncbi:MAG: hypothetical protein ACRDQ7_17845 [Haloechinothrix sp.]
MVGGFHIRVDDVHPRDVGEQARVVDEPLDGRGRVAVDLASLRGPRVLAVWVIRIVGEPGPVDVGHRSLLQRANVGDLDDRVDPYPHPPTGLPAHACSSYR